MLTVFVVSHTHWDREWYQPAERFRQRLVPLIDELLDDPPTMGTSFLLDGQTAVLDDYLDVRPERASDLASALRARRIEAGPWFVLPDALIPSGEGLVRNLAAGRRALRALRADSPRVLYCPDSFGHPAALPAIAQGFDLPVVIVWRGFGGSTVPAGDTHWWSAAGGERVLLHHLTRSGYELGANLPTDVAGAGDRWTSIREEFGTRSNAGVALLLNGADHHARQTNLAAALDALRQAAVPDLIKPGRLSDFALELERRTGPRALAEVRGELRDSYGYTWTLQGTLASRAPQKRRYARAERQMIRDVEPWNALATFHGAASRRPLMHAAWRPLLLCQPHDTLCGCSIDQVARAMDARIESAVIQGDGIREDALLDWIGHDREAARHSPAAWQPIVLVRNRAARARTGVAMIELTRKIADAPVGPGSRSAPLPKGAVHERTEAPRSYPRNDAVARVMTPIWLGPVPAYGVVSLPVAQVGTGTAAPETPATVKGRSMSNGRLTLAWDAKGRVSLEDSEGRAIRDLIEWESRRDEGDLYTPSIRGKKLSARHAGTKVVERGPLRVSVEQRWTLAAKGERVDVRVRLTVDAGAPFVRIRVEGENHARDHRLRLLVRHGLRGGQTVADAAFGTVVREPIEVTDAAAKIERPPSTEPLHRYVSRFLPHRGATLFSDGLTEYEAARDAFAITILRAVGELSRGHLPERPGHAGWPAPTPEGQCAGPFEAEVALLLHGPRTPAVIDDIERASDDALYPLVGSTLRSALRVPPRMLGVSLEGIGLAFSCAKQADDGDALVLRCVNLLDQETTGTWQLGRAIRDAHLARLDETLTTPLVARGDSVAFRAPPRAIVTILIR